MIYLSSPYFNNPDYNYRLAVKLTAHLIIEGFVVYSPVVHRHPLHEVALLSKDPEFWRSHNFAMLRRASELWVIRTPEWDFEREVLYDIKFAKLAYIPTYGIDPRILSRDNTIGWVERPNTMRRA